MVNETEELFPVSLGDRNDLVFDSDAPLSTESILSSETLMRTESELFPPSGGVTELSAGGCLVTSDGPLSEGDLLELRIDLPELGELTTWGNVVFRVRETGFGVRFGAYSQGGAREKVLDMLGANP